MVSLLCPLVALRKRKRCCTYRLRCGCMRCTERRPLATSLLPQPNPKLSGKPSRVAQPAPEPSAPFDPQSVSPQQPADQSDAANTGSSSAADPSVAVLGAAAGKRLTRGAPKAYADAAMADASPAAAVQEPAAPLAGAAQVSVAASAQVVPRPSAQNPQLGTAAGHDNGKAARKAAGKRKAGSQQDAAGSSAAAASASAGPQPQRIRGAPAWGAPPSGDAADERRLQQQRQVHRPLTGQGAPLTVPQRCTPGVLCSLVPQQMMLVMRELPTSQVHALSGMRRSHWLR